MILFKLTLVISVLATNCEINLNLRPLGSCGRSLSLGGGGVQSEKNQWPWLAALFYAPSGIFFCGGTLISHNHVLTAAHCIQQKDVREPLRANQLTIQLGRYNLSHSSEFGALNLQPSEILIHPQWNASSERYDADIAILHFAFTVEQSATIQTVAFWSKDSIVNESVEGTVAGWGASERTEYLGHEEVPYQVAVKRVPTIQCFLNDYLFAKISSNRTFCAEGVKENSGPCSGDSGGGFYIKHDDSWYIFGIISGSFFNKNLVCDLRKNTVYTTIADFGDWVVASMENHLQNCKTELNDYYHIPNSEKSARM